MGLRLMFSRQGEDVGSYELDGPLHVGRQQTPSEAWPALLTEGGGRRLVVCPLDEKGVSRHQLTIAPTANGRSATLKNAGGYPVQVNGGSLAAGSLRELAPPFVVRVGRHVLLRVDDPRAVNDLAHLADVTRPPFARVVPELFPGAASTGAEGTDAVEVVRWLTNTIDVFQSAATSDAFFERAARAMVEALGFDCGRVLLYEDGEWSTQATHAAGQTNGGGRPWEPSVRVLDQVLQRKDTFWGPPVSLGTREASLLDVEAVIAAPVLDRAGGVIGVLYGDRRRRVGQSAITRLEAMLTKLLACAVAAGLARLREEEAALTARGRFEQFFTPELAGYLAAHPELVECGRDAEVTILFCDVRGFSRISERLGPARTAGWMNAVMDRLSEPVRDTGGVLVDYIGDALVAMWGAPVPQPDHVELACRAAAGILNATAELDAQWREEIGGPFAVGVGISSGAAYVGNTGSRYKFKYGPLGHTVNLASRAEGATKFLRVPCLFTEGTFHSGGEPFAARRVCRVGVVNIDEPVALYELMQCEQPDLKREYEAALDHFERGEFTAAAERLGRILSQHPDDGPSQILLMRTAQCIAAPPADFDPVWRLSEK